MLNTINNSKNTHRAPKSVHKQPFFIIKLNAKKQFKNGQIESVFAFIYGAFYAHVLARIYIIRYRSSFGDYLGL